MKKNPPLRYTTNDDDDDDDDDDDVEDGHLLKTFSDWPYLNLPTEGWDPASVHQLPLTVIGRVGPDPLYRRGFKLRCGLMRGYFLESSFLCCLALNPFVCNGDNNHEGKIRLQELFQD